MRYQQAEGDAARAELRRLLIALIGDLDEPASCSLSGPAGSIAGPGLIDLLTSLQNRTDEIEADGAAILAVMDGLHQRVQQADTMLDPFGWSSPEG